MVPQTLSFGQSTAKDSLASRPGLGKHDFVHLKVWGGVPLHTPGDEGGGAPPGGG